MEYMIKNKNEQLTNWVNEYSDKLYSWAFYKTSKKEVAEDLVQETFLSAFKSFDNFKFESQPQTWLFKILNNKIIDYYRLLARNIEQVTDDEFLSKKTTDALFNNSGQWVSAPINSQWEEQEHLLDNVDFTTVLTNCIKKLPQNWRIAIESKYQEEKKATDICKELDITSSNYWQMIHRAKLQLKICIEKNWIIK
ncbi:MAG: RNA polymerase subunit sigma [Bacteroidetes bacterium HGW-Bacteroidetes-12]|nr:MAG: RNA polymerase subunit sigma [Bacteroidetes bacterium HGW-Bacteroidetes-12]